MTTELKWTKVEAVEGIDPKAKRVRHAAVGEGGVLAYDDVNTFWIAAGGKVIGFPRSDESVPHWIPDGKGFLGLSTTGTLWRREKESLQKLAEPKGFAERWSVQAGHHPIDGRPLFFGGTPPRARTPTDEVWAWDGKKLEKLKVRAPAEYGAYSMRLPHRNQLVLLGGQVTSGHSPRATGKMHVFDGKEWTSSRTNESAGDTLKALFVDPKTQHLLAVHVTPDGDSRIAIHEGNGQWRIVARIRAMHRHEELSNGQAVAMWFDGRERTLNTFGRLFEGEREGDLSGGPSVRFGFRGVSLARVLDALPAAGAAPQAPVKRGKAAVPRKAFAMKLGKKGPDQAGGLPPGVTDARWPRCEQCREPMVHLALFRSNPVHLPLDAHGALALFACDSASCARWDPDQGANAVVLLSERELTKPALKAPPKRTRGKAVVLEQRAIAYEPPVDELDPKTAGPEQLLSDDKAGGYPSWLQSPELPKCHECRKAMRFVAQYTPQDRDEFPAKEDRGVTFGDSGTGYLFLCPAEHTAALVGQST